MATKVRCKSFQILATDTGTKDFTISGLGSASLIKGAMVVMTRATALDTITAGMGMSIGFTDGTYTGSMGISAEDNVATADNDRWRSGDRLGFVPNFNQTADCEIGFNSFITDGIRVDIDNQAGSDWRLIITFFTGSDVQCKAGEAETGDSGDPHNVDLDPGFVADLAFFASTRTGSLALPAAPAASIWASLCVGVASNDTGFPQGALTHAFNDGNSTQTGSGGIESDEVILNHGIGTSFSLEANVTSFTQGGDNIRLNVTGSDAGSSSKPFIWFAVKTGRPVKLLNVEIPAATGNEDYNVGFKAQAGGALFSIRDTADALTLGAQCSSWGLGFFDEDVGDASMSWNIQDGVSTMNANVLIADKAAVVLESDGTAGADASVSSLASPNVQLNWASVFGSARKMLLWAIQESPAAVGPTEDEELAITPVGGPDEDGQFHPHYITIRNSLFLDKKVDGTVMFTIGYREVPIGTN